MFADGFVVSASLGSIVGLILAISGAGGGIIAVPLLVFGLDLPIQQASPIALLAVGLAAALGALLGLRNGILRYRAAALMGSAAILSAPLGVFAAHHLPNGPLMLAFAAIMAWTAYRMLHRSRNASASSTPQGQSESCRLNPEIHRLDWSWPCARALAATGLMSGLLSGMLGVGGGFVIVPALTRHTNLPPLSIMATSLGVIALASVSGIAAAAAAGAISYRTAASFVCGAFVGMVVGRHLASRLGGPRLEASFAAVCLGVSILMAARAAHIWT